MHLAAGLALAPRIKLRWRDARLQRGVGPEAGVQQAKRPGHERLKCAVQPHAGDLFGDHAEQHEVHVAVHVPCTRDRIRADQHQLRARVGSVRRFLVEGAPRREAAAVREELPDRDVRRARPAPFRQIAHHRCIQRNTTLIHELHDQRCRRNDLRQRGEVVDGRKRGTRRVCGVQLAHAIRRRDANVIPNDRDGAGKRIVCQCARQHGANRVAHTPRHARRPAFCPPRARPLRVQARSARQAHEPESQSASHH